MNPALVTAMLAPAGLAACCTVADPHRRSARVWVLVVLMLGAMVDATVLGIVPAVVWAVALCVAAVLSAGLSRRAVAEGSGLEPMAIHRSLSAVVMAFLLLIGGSAHPASPEPSSSAHAHAPAVAALAAVAVAALLLFALALIAREPSRHEGAVHSGSLVTKRLPRETGRSVTEGVEAGCTDRRRRGARVLLAAEPLLMSLSLVAMLAH